MQPTPNRMGLGMPGRPPFPGQGQGPPIGALAAQPPPFVPGGALPPPGIAKSATLFIGSISAGISDTFLNELLGACGPVNPLKRMITPAGKPQGFGFVEFQDVESAVRAVKLLNGVELPAFEDGCANKKLLVKPDEKTRIILDMYSSTQPATTEADTKAQSTIQSLVDQLIERSKAAADSGLLDKEKYVIPPHLHDLQEADLPETQRGLITSEIAMFREKSAKREREKFRDVMGGGSTPTGPRTGGPTREWGKPNASASPGGGGTPQGPKGFGKGNAQSYDKPVGFVKAESSSTPTQQQKSDFELEEERKEARKAEELRSFKDRERRYEPRERTRLTAIERAIARDQAQQDAEERDREEMKRRLDIWDDDESDELFYTDRARWRSTRSRLLNSETAADEKSRVFEEQEAENLRRESEMFLERQMEEMRGLMDEQRKAGMLLDDGAPVRLAMGASSGAAPSKGEEFGAAGKKVVFAQDDEDEDALRLRRKAQLQKLDFSVEESVSREKTRERLEDIKKKVPQEKDELFAGKVRWDGVGESMIDRKFEPLLKKLMSRYLGLSPDDPTDDADDLVMFVLEHLKDRKGPSKLVEGLEPVLEEDALPLTIAVWRQVIFESMAYSEGLLTENVLVD